MLSTRSAVRVLAIGVALAAVASMTTGAAGASEPKSLVCIANKNTWVHYDENNWDHKYTIHEHHSARLYSQTPEGGWAWGHGRDHPDVNGWMARKNFNC